MCCHLFVKDRHEVRFILTGVISFRRSASEIEMKLMEYYERNYFPHSFKSVHSSAITNMYKMKGKSSCLTIL